MPKKQTNNQDLAPAMAPGHFRRILKKTPAAPYKNFFWPTIPQRQAPSSKRQASSSPAGLNDATIKK